MEAGEKYSRYDFIVLGRKIFSTKSKKIQSGGVFFTLILLFLLSDQNLYLTISLILILFLGIFSDVDFITSPKIRFLFQLIIIILLLILIVLGLIMILIIHLNIKRNILLVFIVKKIKMILIKL